METPEGTGAQVRSYHVRCSVPSRHTFGDLHHLAPELPTTPGEQVAPYDDLHVSRLVLNGHEDRAVPAPAGAA